VTDFSAVLPGAGAAENELGFRRLMWRTARFAWGGIDFIVWKHDRCRAKPAQPPGVAKRSLNQYGKVGSGVWSIGVMKARITGEAGVNGIYNERPHSELKNSKAEAMADN